MRRPGKKFAFTIFACAGILTALLFADNIPDGLPAKDRRLLRLISVVQRLTKAASYLHSISTGTHPIKSQRRIREEILAPWLFANSPNSTFIEQQVLNLDGVSAISFTHKSHAQSSDRLPGLIYLHGGGWAFGSSQFYQPIFHELISRFNGKLKVISIDYRLVPDFVYPVQLDDCVRAVKVLLDSPENFQLDREKLILAGDSAGGNLALAVSLRLRDEGYTSKSSTEADDTSKSTREADTTSKPSAKIKSQILIYPTSHAIHFLTKSFQLYDNMPILTKSGAINFILDYMNETHTKQTVAKVGQNRHVSDAIKLTKAWKYAASFSDPKADHTAAPLKSLASRMSTKLIDPYLFPLFADDLSHNLPKTYILTCEYDVIRDDGLALAKRMLDEAPKTDAVVHKNLECFHGGLNMFERSDTGARIMDVFVEWIRENVGNFE